MTAQALIEQHRRVQNAARDAMRFAQSYLRPGVSLHELRNTVEDKLRELGADSFWYWDIGAFVFGGDSTVESVPGRTYLTPDHLIAADDLVTIDLSPQIDGIWGDFARTIIVENGRALDNPTTAANTAWADGIRTEFQLHAELLQLASPTITFEHLHQAMNERLTQLGYENLDFLGNLGHSIERRSSERIYVEAGNARPLGSGPCSHSSRTSDGRAAPWDSSTRTFTTSKAQRCESCKTPSTVPSFERRTAKPAAVETD